MNQKDVATVLGIFAGNWPGKPIEANTPIVWFEATRHIPGDEALDTAYWIVAHQDRWPSVAEFIANHNHIVKSKYWGRAEEYGLPEDTGGLSTRESAHMHIGELKQMLAGMTGAVVPDKFQLPGSRRYPRS